MLDLLIEAGIWLALYIVNRVTQPTPTLQMSSNTLQLPTTEQGAGMPMVFGRVRIEQPVLAFIGPIKESFDTTRNQSWYSVDQFFVVGIPMPYSFSDPFHANPKLWNMWIGDMNLNTQGKLIPKTSYGNGAPMPLRGGQWTRVDDLEDNMVLGGALTFYDGITMQCYAFLDGVGTGFSTPQDLTHPSTETTPSITTRIATSFANAGVNFADRSSYRNYMTVALTGLRNDGATQWNVGAVAQLPAVSFEASSYGDFAHNPTGTPIGLDANPADCLLVLLTSTWACLGWSISQIDTTSFENAAVTLYNEGNGYSRVISQRANAPQAISELLNQMDAQLFKEPTTGKLTLKLIRGDYSPPALATFSDALGNIVEVTSYALGAWPDTYNRVELRYNNRDKDYRSDVAIADDMANQNGQAATGVFDGKLRTVTIDMPGVCSATNAHNLAARELGVVARPLAKLTMVVNRDGINVRPGDAINVAYGEYNINTVFRVATIDFGQLFDNKVTINAIEDIFANPSQSFTGTTSAVRVLLPPTIVSSQEAPYFLARLTANSGAIANADVPHTMTLAAKSGTGGGYNSKSSLYRSGSALSGQNLYDLTTIDGAAGPDPTYAGDTPNVSFQWYGTVETAVNREDEPYMSTSTLRVTLVSGTPDADLTKLVSMITWINVGGHSIPITSKSYQADVDSQRQNIAQRGQFLMMIDSEIVAYEGHFTDPVNPNVVVFTGVWRGLLDTAPRSHAIGARVYGMRGADNLLFTDIPQVRGGISLKPSSGIIGRTGFGISDIVDTRVCPTQNAGGLIVDLGAQANDTFLLISGRAFAPFAPADFGLTGIACSGGTGQPARAQTPNYSTTTGSTLFKRVDSFDEGLETFGSFRDRTSTSIVRGDAGDDQVLSTTQSHQMRVVIVNYSSSLQNFGLSASLGTQSSPQFHGKNLIEMGHGPLDVQLRATDNNATNSTHRSYQTPTIRVNAKRWRNLLINSRGDYGDGSGWTLSAGTAWTILTGTAALSRSTSGHYYRLSPSGTMYQHLDCKMYKPGGLLAVPQMYIFGGSGTDTLGATLSFYDQTGTLISTATTSSFVGGNAYWRRLDATGGLAVQTVPQNAAQVRLTLTWTNASGGLFLSDVQLRVGEYGSVGLSEAFDGATTSWSNVVLNTTAGIQYTNRLTSANHNVVMVNSGTDGTSPITDRIVDDCDGLEYATAVLTWAMTQLSAGTATGETILEVLDSGNNVITSVTSGAVTPSTVGAWQRQEISIDLPDNAVTFRVRLKQTGTSQLIGWDDFDLKLWAPLARVASQGINAMWFVPNRQYTPQTWTEYYQVHPLHPAPLITFAKGLIGEVPSTDSEDHVFAWSDGLAHDVGKFTLISGAQNPDSLVPICSSDCYHFARTTIITGVDILLTSDTDLAAFTSLASFSCSVMFRVDELVWAGACGLVGRRGSSSGWSIEIDTTGHLIAALISPDGSKTVTRSGSTVIDGAMHLACIVYDAVAKVLRIHDERGFDSVSTASGMGEFALTGGAVRLGRARLLTDVLPGDILTCTIQSDALTTAQVAELWTYGKDPNNVLTYSRSAAAWSSGYPDSAGATLTKFSTDQLALAYDAGLSQFFAQAQYPGFGMPVQPADINYAYTFDTTFTPRWIAEGIVTFDSTIVDPTGSPKGLRVGVNDVTAGGLMLQTATLGFGQQLTFVFWARVIAGGPQLDMTFYSAGFPNVFGTASVQLTRSWARYVVTFSAAFTITPNAFQVRMRLHNTDTTTLLGFPLAVWDMGHVYFFGQSNSAPVVPYLIADPGASAQTSIKATATQPLHLVTEGEIAVVGIAPNSVTDVPATGVEPATTAALIKQAAGGYGTFAAGWLCNDTVGNLAATFGSPTLTASNLTYANAGPFGNTDKAIGFSTAAGTAAGASSDFDVAATDDLLIVWVGKWSATPVASGAIVSKITGSASDGYFLGTTVTDYEFFVAHGGSQAGSTIGATYLAGRWHIGVVAIDRSTGLGQMGVIALDDGSITLGNQIPGLAATFTTTQAFSVGAGGFANAATGFALADLYMGKGAGIATGVPANLTNVLANLARGLHGGSIARLEVPSSIVNLRELVQGFGGAPGLYHVASDGTTGTRSQASGFDWTTPWALRARWARLGLWEDPSLHGAGIVQVDVNDQIYTGNSNYSTPGGFAAGGTALSVLRIGATCQPMLIGQVVLSVAPPKIAPTAGITSSFFDYP